MNAESQDFKLVINYLAVLKAFKVIYQFIKLHLLEKDLCTPSQYLLHVFGTSENTLHDATGFIAVFQCDWDCKLCYFHTNFL